MRALVVRQEFSSSNPVKGVDHDYSSMKIKILGGTPGRGREFHVTVSMHGMRSVSMHRMRSHAVAMSRFGGESPSESRNRGYADDGSCPATKSGAARE